MSFNSTIDSNILSLISLNKNTTKVLVTDFCLFKPTKLRMLYTETFIMKQNILTNNINCLLFRQSDMQIFSMLSLQNMRLIQYSFVETSASYFIDTKMVVKR